MQSRKPQNRSRVVWPVALAIIGFVVVLVGAAPFERDSNTGAGTILPSGVPSELPPTLASVSLALETPEAVLPNCGGALPMTSAARQLWLSAASLGTTYGNAQAVGSWPECSSSAKDAVQSAVSSRPQYLSVDGPGGAAAVSFDGADDYMTVASQPLDLAGGVSVVAVIWLDTQGTGSLPSGRGVLGKGYDCYSASANCWQLFTDTWSGNNYFYFESQAAAAPGAYGLVVDGWMIATATLDGGRLDWYFNGASSGASLDFNYATSSEELVVGAVQGGVGSYSPSRIKLAELALYKGALSAADRKAVECSLRARYSGLPAYATSCP